MRETRLQALAAMAIGDSILMADRPATIGALREAGREYQSATVPGGVLVTRVGVSRWRSLCVLRGRRETPPAASTAPAISLLDLL